MADQRKLITKRLKKAFPLRQRLFHAPTRALIQDVKYLHCDILDVLEMQEWTTEEKYLKIIWDWFEMENEAYQYVPSLEYKAGTAAALSDLIEIRRENWG
jgi:hypothetical protein